MCMCDMVLEIAICYYSKLEKIYLFIVEIEINRGGGLSHGIPSWENIERRSLKAKVDKA